MNLKRSILHVLLVTLVAFSLFHGGASEETTGKTHAEVLYKDAQELVADKHYLQAIEYLNQLRSQHPYSYYATHAELLLADIYYMQENYIEAAAAYTLFRDLHPKHEKNAYVLFRIAESHYMQKPSSIDRDLDSCYNAIKYYAELLQLYPKSEYTRDAMTKINESKKMIEERERYIAGFYFKTKEYAAARYRCKDTIINFDGKELKQYCAEVVLHASLKLKEKKQCLLDAKWLDKEVNLKETPNAQDYLEQCKKLEDEKNEAKS